MKLDLNIDTVDSSLPFYKLECNSMLKNSDTCKIISDTLEPYVD